LDSTLIKILKGKRKKKRSCKYGEIFFVDIKNQTDRALKSKSKPNFLQKKKNLSPTQQVNGSCKIGSALVHPNSNHRVCMPNPYGPYHTCSWMHLVLCFHKIKV
jgi:hypothetical protein